MKNNELITILKKFSIEGKDFQFHPIGNGLINDTFLVLEQNTPLYILQRINQDVFKDMEGLMGNIQTALDYLRDVDYSPITLSKTISGKTYYQHKGQGNWRIMNYIGQSTTYNISADPKIAYETGRILGKFHLLLKDAPMEVFVDTIPQFHNLQLRAVQFEQSLTIASPKKIDIALSAIAFAKETLLKLQELQGTKLPQRICHNDTKLNNILFSKKNSKALCLIDLDTIMRGYFYNDFGDAVRTVANTANEDEKDLHKITFDKNLFEAFMEGLQTNASFLTKEEIQFLPLGAIFMPFIHGLRALTDYLNNNIYYKVSYENQNLDRCLSLFEFTKKALNELDYMKIVVKEKLIPYES